MTLCQVTHSRLQALEYKQQKMLTWQRKEKTVLHRLIEHIFYCSGVRLEQICYSEKVFTVHLNTFVHLFTIPNIPKNDRWTCIYNVSTLDLLQSHYPTDSSY